MRQKSIDGMAALVAGLLVMLAGLIVGVPPARASDTVSAGETPVLKTQKDRASYAMGVEAARNFKRLGIYVDIGLIIRGMKDVATGDKLLLTEEDFDSALTTFRAEMIVKRGSERLRAALENKKEEDEFLSVNKAKDGVVTLTSGLQYKVIKASEGEKPTDDDTVMCNYRGTLINGTLFESTYAAGQPATMRVSDPRVIAGLREALKLMPVGSKWQIFIPSRLAYLGVGRGREIGPNATLVFELELLAIK